MKHESLEEVAESGRLKKKIERYLKTCRAKDDTAKKGGRFPNLAGFCRWFGCGLSAVEQLRLTHPEAVDYLIAVMDVDNPASRRTAEKSGFRLFEKRTVYDYSLNRYADDYFYFRRYASFCTLKERFYGDAPYYGHSTSDRPEEAQT